MLSHTIPQTHIGGCLEGLGRKEDLRRLLLKEKCLERGGRMGGARFEREFSLVYPYRVQEATRECMQGVAVVGDGIFQVPKGRQV